jgi:hypothetical protein
MITCLEFTFTLNNEIPEFFFNDPVVCTFFILIVLVFWMFNKFAEVQFSL